MVLPQNYSEIYVRHAILYIKNCDIQHHGQSCYAMEKSTRKKLWKLMLRKFYKNVHVRHYGFPKFNKNLSDLHNICQKFFTVRKYTIVTNYVKSESIIPPIKVYISPSKLKC